MAIVSFHADDLGITNLNGSGLGFFGSTFGNSVSVNSWQDTTYITDGNGIIQNAQVNNTKWTHSASGSVNGAGSINLINMTNKLSTLRIRFNHTTSIKTQNVILRIFDRTNIDNPASGVVTKVAEIIHPNVTADATGSGDTSWITPTGSSVIMNLVASPGESGLRPNGGNTTDKNHDWHISCSASPSQIGSKTNFALYVALEYL